MTDQQSTHAALSPAVNIYYEKKILKDFEPEVAFFTHAPVKTMIPQFGGNIVEFTRYLKIAGNRQDNTNQFTARQTYFSATTVQATLHERDSYVQLSRFVSLTAISNALDQAAMKMRQSGQKTINKLIRNDIGFAVADKALYSANMWQNLEIDGGTLNSTGITARFWTMTVTDGFPMYHNKTRLAQSSTIVAVAGSAMTIKTLQHGVKTLQGNDVEKLGGTYKLICHPDVSYQITTNAGFKGWFAPTTAEPGKSDPTILGVVAGVSIINSTESYKYPVSGDTLSTSSGNVYGSLLFGEEAYGCSQISGEGNRSGFNFYLKQSGPQSTNDPTNMIKQAAISCTAVGRVLNKSAGLWLVTTGL